MLPKEGLPDRRETRSADPLVALARLFESARRRAGFEAIVLADETGVTIAGAGAAAACDDLAARAASLAGMGAANDTVPCRLDVLARAMEVRRLRIDGIEVLLCTEGGPFTSGADLSHAASGCQRILGRHRNKKDTAPK